MKEMTTIQEQYASNYDRRKICSYDLEFIEEPTSPIIHQQSRYLFFLKGEGRITVDGVEYEIHPHTMIAILPWTITQIIKVNKPLEFVKIVYNSEYVNNFVKNIYNPEYVVIRILQMIAHCPVIRCNAIQTNQILSIMDDIKREVGAEYVLDIKEQNELSNVYINNKLVELTIFFSRMVYSSSKNEISRKSETDNQQLIFKYMYSHLCEKLTLSRLSKLFYMSESSISKHIQDIVGLSFNELLNEMRIAKALDMLMYSDLTLQDIAESVGYTDASHLLRAFTSRVGTTPNEYRKYYQNASDILKQKERDLTFGIINYLYNNYNESINAQSTAENFHISVTELNRILLYQVEKNFDDYLNSLRISKACELLITTNDAISDIAIEVGYNTTKTFNRLFVLSKGMTPGVFRKSINLQFEDGTTIHCNEKCK